ncbi:hypothetical protein PTTG_27976 [Puccinia triticina 1-1 BBBD Race 1]|uniref:Uncharacterized protein n=2 Tax=Puccinia triticina TaxID=208348 RepID=A0A180GFP1_PUCT1|nr:uncharacterized protein PtA15_3A358 [Puccinia triticina]OAV91394.1 hypothetical protein PTTG_27976 [Puccinia triticina 1-1 BBBD Race 1]WAQ82992.1 hypothetical protein PtA15_3A358 [Puccinia triticina]WAR53819.1 hypothetical protein PtB15_3B328 [Puccinia triticina]
MFSKGFLASLLLLSHLYPFFAMENLGKGAADYRKLDKAAGESTKKKGSWLGRRFKSKAGPSSSAPAEDTQDEVIEYDRYRPIPEAEDTQDKLLIAEDDQYTGPMANHLFDKELEHPAATTALKNFFGGFFPLYSENEEAAFRERYVTREPPLQNLLNSYHSEAAQHKSRGPQPLSTNMIEALEGALYAIFQLQQPYFKPAVQMAYYGQAFCVITREPSLLSELIQSYIIKSMNVQSPNMSGRLKFLYKAMLEMKEWSSSLENPTKQASMVKRIYDRMRTRLFLQGESIGLGDNGERYLNRYFYGEKPLADMWEEHLKDFKRGKLGSNMKEKIKSALNAFFEIQDTDAEGQLKIAYYTRRFFGITAVSGRPATDRRSQKIILHIKSRMQLMESHGQMNSSHQKMWDVLLLMWT